MTKLVTMLFFRISLVLIAVIYLSGCASITQEEPPESSYKMPITDQTHVGRAVLDLSRQYPGRSGVSLLNTGRAALTARLMLADMAEQSIDAQYYIWNDDITGALLSAHLLRAAERGVRVRVLLDDIGSGGKDHKLADLDRHPNVSIRIYNPSRAGLRSGMGKLLDFIIEFDRMNRRSHIKTFTVDSAVSVVGGRNIGDEYFDADPEVNFRDRDLLVSGPTATEVGGGFDIFWNSPWAVPIDRLKSSNSDDNDINALYSRLLALLEDPKTHPYKLPAEDESAALFETTMSEQEWLPVSFWFDRPPEEGEQSLDNVHTSLANQTRSLLTELQDELLLESAYFILQQDNLQLASELKSQGIKFRIMTNSLATNDLWTVHSAYTKSREALLKDDVEIHELRPDAAICGEILGSAALCGEEQKLSLHAKTMVIDNQTVVVGSFNVNPRSRFLNAESVLVVRDANFAKTIADDIRQLMQPENSWQVKLDDDGNLRWSALRDGKEIVREREPDTSWWLRLKTGVVSLIPLEKYW